MLYLEILNFFLITIFPLCFLLLCFVLLSSSSSFLLFIPILQQYFQIIKPLPCLSGKHSPAKHRKARTLSKTHKKHNGEREGEREGGTQTGKATCIINSQCKKVAMKYRILKNSVTHTYSGSSNLSPQNDARTVPYPHTCSSNCLIGSIKTVSQLNSNCMSTGTVPKTEYMETCSEAKKCALNVNLWRD